LLKSFVAKGLLKQRSKVLSSLWGCKLVMKSIQRRYWPKMKSEPVLIIQKSDC